MAICFREITLVEWFLPVFSRHYQKFLEKDNRKSITYYEQLIANLWEIERAINERPCNCSNLRRSSNTLSHDIW